MMNDLYIDYFLIGPLVTPSGRGRSYVQIGIVSGGNGSSITETAPCSTRNGRPNIFTRVSSYYGFINRNLQGRKCPEA